MKENKKENINNKNEKNGKKNGKASNILSVIAIIIALLCLALILYWDSSGYLKGDPGLSIKGEQGEPGYTPIKGVDYTDGKDGFSPAFEWKGTSLRFQYSNGTWGSFINLKGDTGGRGSDGKDGTDAPVSNPPMITNVILGGYLCYTHNISFNVYDADDDMVRITISWSTDNASWCQQNIQYGVSGGYTDQVTIRCPTIYWLIELWDGNHVAGEYYSYTIA